MPPFVFLGAKVRTTKKSRKQLVVPNDPVVVQEDVDMNGSDVEAPQPSVPRKRRIAESSSEDEEVHPVVSEVERANAPPHPPLVNVSVNHSLVVPRKSDRAHKPTARGEAAKQALMPRKKAAHGVLPMTDGQPPDVPARTRTLEKAAPPKPKAKHKESKALRPSKTYSFFSCGAIITHVVHREFMMIATKFFENRTIPAAYSAFAQRLDQFSATLVCVLHCLKIII